MREPAMQDPDAAWSAVGAFFLEPELLAHHAADIPDGALPEPQATILRAMCALHGEGKAVDVVTVADHLRASGELEDVGGVQTIARVVDAVPTAANLEAHLDILRDKWTRRRIRELADEADRRAVDAGPDGAAEVLDWMETEVLGLSRHLDTGDSAAVSDVVWDVLDDVDAAHGSDRDVVGLTTGFAQLDRDLNGLEGGELIPVAGRPGMGKTAWSCDVARHVALEEETPVAIFSLEMGRKPLTLRMVCAEAGLPFARVRTGDVRGEHEWDALSGAASTLNGAPIHIHDRAALSVLQLRSAARRLYDREGIGLIIVDYLQLMTGPDADRREQEVAGISRGLKALARELEVPVLALSQLNRNLEQRGDKRPRLADLRESGAIEQDADAVLFVHRPEVYHGAKGPDGADLRGKAELIIGKQRNGPTRTIPLRFDKETVSFRTDPTGGVREAA